MDSATCAYNGIPSDTGSAMGSSAATYVAHLFPSFVLDEDDCLIDLSQIPSLEDEAKRTASSYTAYNPIHKSTRSRDSANVGARLQNTSAPAEAPLARQSGSEDDSCSSGAGSTSSSTPLTTSGLGLSSPESSLDGHSDYNTSKFFSTARRPPYQPVHHSNKGPSCWEDLTTGFSNLDLRTPRGWNDSTITSWTASRDEVEYVSSTNRAPVENPRRRLPPRMEAAPTYASVSSKSFNTSATATATADKFHSPLNTPVPIHSTSTQDQPVGPSLGPRFNNRHSPSFTQLSSPRPSRSSDSGSQCSYSPSITSSSTTTENTNKSSSGHSKKSNNNNKKPRQDKRLYITDPHAGPRPTDWMLSEETIKTREARDARFMQIVSLGLAPGRTKAGWAQARRPGKRDRDAAKVKLREVEEEKERERLKALLGEQVQAPVQDTLVH